MISSLTYLFLLPIALIPLVPAVVFFVRRRKKDLRTATKGLMVGLGSMNVIIGLMALALGIVWFFTPHGVQAAGAAQAATSTDSMASLGAALSTGMAAIGAGIAVGNTGAAALGAIAEKPEMFGQALIFVGLSEGIAIYGLLISFLLLNR